MPLHPSAAPLPDSSCTQAHYKTQAEARKAATKEEKLERREADAKVKAEYGFAMMDGHKLPLGNFKIEPPGACLSWIVTLVRSAICHGCLSVIGVVVG